MTLYVTAVSFEDRCLALTERKDLRVEDSCVLVLHFEGYENVGPYLANIEAIRRRLAATNVSTSEIPCRTSTPIAATNAVRQEILRRQPERLCIDISTLPKSFLFCLSRLALDLGIETEIIYYRPREYGDDLSRGVRSVQAVPGFEGDPTPGGNVALIALLGFEGYKACQVWEQLGPTDVVALWGDPPYHDNFLRLSREKNQQFLELANGADEGVCHTFDVWTAMQQLQEAYQGLRERLPDSSIVVCPLGTKLQSLATFGLVHRHPDVSLIYVTSERYFTGSYSKGWLPDVIQISLQELVNTSPV